ncbi:hypothetical protein ACFLTE_03745 [Bacteroidota bacterium]
MGRLGLIKIHLYDDYPLSIPLKSFKNNFDILLLYVQNIDDMAENDSKVFYENPDKLKKNYRNYFLLAGILFLAFPVFNYYFDSSISLGIFNVLFMVAGVFYILLGIGEFSNRYDRHVKITKEYFIYKLGNKKSRSLPWDHMIKVEEKEDSILFTFKNKGVKEIQLAGFNKHDIESIKESIMRVWDLKRKNLS